MSKSLKEAEKIAGDLKLELQAMPQDQILDHFKKRIDEIPEEYRKLVDGFVGATLVYGHKTSESTPPPSSLVNEGTKPRNSVYARNRFFFLSAVLAIVGAIGVFSYRQLPTQASSPGRSELRQVRFDERQNLIVFVHGIRDNGNLTWTNSETNANWLEMIKEDDRFVGFDLASYHYSSMLFQSGSLSISSVADQLAFRLDSELVDAYDSIVFVAHSMGGIVVRNLLLKNNLISEKVPLVYFLATPTAGADIAKLAGILDFNSRQLRALTSFEKSNFLQNQNSSWRASELFSTVYSLCAFESKPTHNIMVVDQASAQSLCSKRTIPSGETHTGIAKPYSRDSIVYKVFADQVDVMFSTSRDESNLNEAQLAPLKTLRPDGKPYRNFTQEAQYLLGLLGYEGITPDGFEGPLTTRALEEFQNTHSIPISGAADEETIRILRLRAEKSFLRPINE